MSLRVSIIIPCYNQGRFIADALKSIAACDPAKIEVIVINDGSTELQTNEILQALSIGGTKVIFQHNKGLAAARNAGIKIAKGEFILPLDADNMIRPQYIEQGLALMDQHPDVAVVYGNANYFGIKTGLWRPGSFNLQRLMISNYIDACALIRKSVLDDVGYYDEQMKFMGWEDWDRWLAIAFHGFRFHYLDETVFDYRVEERSMITSLYNKYEKPNYLENYVHSKYPEHMGHKWILHYFLVRFKKNPLTFVAKLIILAYFPSYHRKLLLQNKIRNGL
jgi:glycosyltransferase involved in cell wall biosynthesis